MGVEPHPKAYAGRSYLPNANQPCGLYTGKAGSPSVGQWKLYVGQPSTTTRFGEIPMLLAPEGTPRRGCYNVLHISTFF